MNTAMTPAVPEPGYRRILVPFDDSAPSWRALDEAIALAARAGASLRLLALFDETRHASGFEPARILVDEVIPRARQAFREKLRQARAHVTERGRACDSVLVDGAVPDIAGVVQRECARWGADLAVVGTHGRRGVDRLIEGSVAENILRHCDVPLLMVHAPDPD
jgi:nucleotide-binding universal stress UspA family protein